MPFGSAFCGLTPEVAFAQPVNLRSVVYSRQGGASGDSRLRGNDCDWPDLDQLVARGVAGEKSFHIFHYAHTHGDTSLLGGAAEMR